MSDTELEPILTQSLEEASYTDTQDERQLSEIDFENYEQLVSSRTERIVFLTRRGEYEHATRRKLKTISKDIPKVDGEPVVWVDIMFPSSKTMNTLSEHFSVHPLTVEDCIIDAESTMKNELYDSYRFIVDREVYHKPGSNILVSVWINILLFENFIITCHNGPIKSLDTVITRLSSRRKLIMKIPARVMYAMLDCSMDMVVQLTKQFSMEVIALDALVLELSTREETDLLRRIGAARQRSVYLRTLLSSKETLLKSLTNESEISQEELLKAPLTFSVDLERTASLMLTKNTRVYLRDVQDHVRSMLKEVLMLHERLNDLSDTYLARVSISVAKASNRMSKVMKLFSAVATIFLPTTVITGLWGMNVRVPGQNNLVWFYVIATLIVLYVFAILVVFKRLKWIGGDDD